MRNGGTLEQRVAALSPDGREELARALRSVDGGVARNGSDARLVAYVVPNDERELYADDLREHLKPRVPSYMIPTDFVELFDLPRTPNGKLDVGALPEPGAATSSDPASFEAPDSDIEKRLARIWSTLLGFDEISVHDNFFEVGGHSLLAVTLVYEIEQEFGKRLPVATLFEEATIRQLADLLGDEAYAPSWSSLVPMQTDGTGVPVFCVHSWTGDVLMYRGIAARMAPEHPVYGLQAPGLDGETKPLHNMQAMASQYIQEIKSVWPAGPFILVGRCFSGPLALEIGRQLSEDGSEGAVIINLDSGRPERLPPRIRARWAGRDPGPQRKKNFAYYVRRLRKLYEKDGAFGLVWNQLRRRMGSITEREPDVTAVQHDIPLDEHAQAVVAGATQAWLEFEMPKYPGKLMLIRSSENAAKRTKDWHVEDWTKWVGELTTHVVRGKHDTMLLEPEVAGLVTTMKGCIRDALREMPDNGLP